jgi:hypothetical protein
MFIAVLRIMQMKKDCWMVLWYFSIMVESGFRKGKKEFGMERNAIAHQRGV